MFSNTFKETQIKTTMRYLYMLIRIAKIKNRDNTKYWQRCAETRSHVLWG